MAPNAHMLAIARYVWPRRHRRILHLEFAAAGDLPDGYGWHDFIAPA